MLSLVDVAVDVVLPAVRAVFHEGEVTGIHLDIDESQGGSVSLSLMAKGEPFHDWVVQTHGQDRSFEDWRERLRSNLVDFVAESRFGWGENRDMRQP